MPSIGVVVPTYNAQKHLQRCLKPLLHSSLKPEVLIVDSSSQDDTVKIAQELGVKTHIIPKSSFNHGATREWARNQLKTDIVVMITQDAYLESEHALKCLIEPIVRNASSVTYGRQIPHAGANILESFSREFNYPAESHVRALEDVQKHGVYTIFCSNSFAAYSQRALDEIGGFPRVRFGEDTLVVSKLIQKGHKVAYVSEAIVRHSHAYSLKQDFVRNFEIGAMRKTHRELIDVYGRDNARGREYASQLVKKLIMEKPHLVPLGIAKLFSSWLGYKLGRFSVKVD